MRKVLLSLLLVVLLAIFAGIVITGVTLGDINLGYSIQDILDKNDELDKTIVLLNKKIDNEYKAAQSSLDSSFNRLKAEKQNYQQTIAYSTEEELMAANQTIEYKLDYVWTTIGLYATQHGVVLKADLSHGSSGVSNQYNISFTAIGEYLSISEFIYEIEKDPSLGFRIEEFAMVQYSEESLQATFIIKNVAIDPDSLSTSASSVPTGTVTDNTTKSVGGNTTINPNSTTNEANAANGTTQTNAGNTNATSTN